MPLTPFETRSAAGSFTVLTVCTGNICRSPLAAALLRIALADLPTRVHSAGTRALVGLGMPDASLRIAARLGVPDAAAHRARQLRTEWVQDADLILALDREHRRGVVELLPRASRRAFTVREFARFAAAVTDVELDTGAGVTTADRMRHAVEAAAQVRGTLPPLPRPEDDDVVDPYRRSFEVYQESSDQLVPAIEATVSLLRRAVRGAS